MLTSRLPFTLSADQGRSDVAYHLTLANGFPVAINVAQNYQAHFTPLGMEILAGNGRWGLDLLGWGRSITLVSPDPNATAILQDNRLTYQHTQLTAWYVNGTAGVQQGWTVVAPPRGGGSLTLHLRERGSLEAAADPDGHGLTLHDSHHIDVLRYGGLQAFDALGRSLAAQFVVRGDVIQIIVDDRDARYPVTIDPWIQVAKLIASDEAKRDILGRSVAISGDGTTVVVGGPSNAAGGIQRGAAYVYTKSPGGWAAISDFSAKLTASDGGDGDIFGIAVAISSDGMTIVVGASNNGVGGKWRGAVYVYTKPPGGWTTTGAFSAKLTATDEADGDNLGQNLAISADGSTIAAAAPYTAAGGESRGAIYVYTKPLGGWTTTTQTAKLTASDGADYDLLGSSVALSTDGTTIVAGMTQTGSSYQGATYVYTRPPSGWVSTNKFAARLTASDAASGDWMGNGVGISGDGTTIVAGASFNAAGGNSRGAAYVYTKPPGGWATTSGLPQ